MRFLFWMLTAATTCLALFCPVQAGEPVKQHIGVFGDSLGDGVWSGLYAVLKTHPNEKLYRHTKVGAGLTRPDYAAWFTEFTANLDANHITTAVVMFGANDEQGIRDDKRKGYLFQSDGWKQVYRSRVNALLSEFVRRKITVIWIGLPIMRKDDFNTGAIYLNQIFADAAREYQATFLPLADSFKGPDGGFATHLPDTKGRLRQVRGDDGVHFTGYGYELIAQKVYAAIVVQSPEPVAR